MSHLTYELFGGPLDGERGEVKGDAPEVLYRKGGGVVYSEYRIYEIRGSKVVYKPVEHIKESPES